jgi:hypothetical protein
MSKKIIDILNDIIINENAYIYTRQGNRFFPKRTIDNLFRSAKDDKSDQGCRALHQTIATQGISGGKEYRFSALILKYISNPTFLAEPIDGWVEQKLAYLFVADFKNFVIIAKKNISGIQSFINWLEPLDYNIITKLYLEDGTSLEKLTMDNLNFSNKAMRSKSVESDDLADSFNYNGSNTYMLNYLRINNDNDRYAISANTSKIGKAGFKNNIAHFIAWCSGLINDVEHFQDSETFLDVFAKPYDFSTQKANLLPISVTILFSRLVDDLTKGFVTDARYIYGNRQREISLTSRIKGLSRFISLVPDADQPDLYIAEATQQADVYNSIKVRVSDKSIRLASDKMRNIKLYRDNESLGTLIDYFNNKSSFIVNFDQCDFIYGNRKLFKDSNLLGSIDYLLEIFQPDLRISNILTEKGVLTPASTVFQNNSAFYYVEQLYSNSEFLVLDDLGNEWADHIAISGQEICFVHSKCDNTIFSATSFTDVVGQAQKNIGNIFAVDNVLRAKRNKWLGNYALNHVAANLPRLRIGATVDDLINRYIQLKYTPNTKKAVCLVVNFISKAHLTQHLSDLRNDAQFGQRKEAIQILWLISSLIASCRDHSVDITIRCRP